LRVAASAVVHGLKGSRISDGAREKGAPHGLQLGGNKAVVLVQGVRRAHGRCSRSHYAVERSCHEIRAQAGIINVRLNLLQGRLTGCKGACLARLRHRIAVKARLGHLHGKGGVAM